MTTLQPDTHFPAQTTASAVLGYNVPLGRLDLLDLAHVGGASIIRGGSGWHGVEDYETGTLALRQQTAEAITRCVLNGTKIILTMLCDAPHQRIARLTAAADVPVGEKVIPVAGVVPPLKWPYDFFSGKGGAILTNHPTSAGTLIESSTSNSLTLAAATQVPLKANDTIEINRYRYAPVNGTSPTQASVLAYIRAALFVANAAAAIGAKGWLGIANEAELLSHWVSLARCYEGAPPSGVEDDTLGRAVLGAALTAPWPADFKFDNGFSDVTPMADIAKLFNVTAAEAQGAMNGIHLYSTESAMDKAWAKPSYEVLNPVIDNAGAGFHMMAKRDQPFGIVVAATECGTLEPDDTKHAIYLAQRVASCWWDDVPAIVYALDPSAHGMSVVEELTPGVLTERPAYHALKLMTQLVASCGAPGGDASKVPTVAPAFPEGTPEWPLCEGGFYGQNGAVDFLALRTWSEQQKGWTHLTAQPRVMSVSKAARAVDVVTGQDVPISNGQVPVTDHTLALLS